MLEDAQLEECEIVKEIIDISYKYGNWFRTRKKYQVLLKSKIKQNFDFKIRHRENNSGTYISIIVYVFLLINERWILFICYLEVCLKSN